MKQKLIEIAEVENYNGQFIFYKKKQEKFLFYGSMEYIYLIDTDFPIQQNKIEPQPQFSHAYYKFRQFKFSQSSQLKFLLLHKKVKKLHCKQISSLTPIVAKNKLNDSEQPALLLFIQEASQMQKILIFDTKLYSDFQNLKIYSAMAGQHVEHYLSFFQKLSNTSFSVEKFTHIYDIILNNVQNVISGQIQFENCYENNQIWRRIGFQSSKPQTDFRSTGCFGIICIAYFSFFAPFFLLNSSFEKEIVNDTELQQFIDDPTGNYRYPVAAAILNVSHKLLKMKNKLKRLLVNDYINEIDFIANNGEKIKQVIIQANQNEFIVDLEKIDITNFITGYFCQKSLSFNQSNIDIVGIKPVTIDGFQLSCIHPQLGGGFMKLTSQLVLILDRQISKKYCGDEIYMNFNQELENLIQHVDTILDYDDLINNDDLIQRISEVMEL